MKRFVNVRGREIKKARVEIIPMIDAIFFLLIFFMMSSLSMVQMKGMGVSLPKASSATALPPPRLIVTVNDRGNFYLNIDPIEAADLPSTLQQRVTRNPESVIVVNVDKVQSVQTLVNVMDMAGQVRKPNGEPAALMIATAPVKPDGTALAPATSGI